MPCQRLRSLGDWASVVAHPTPIAGMAGPAAIDRLQEQVLELEALESVFGSDLQLSRVEQDNRRFAEAVVAAAAQPSAASAGAADVPALSGTIRLPHCELAGVPVHLAFVLPKQGGEPSLQVQCNAPRGDADRLQQLASSAAAECAFDGQPCLLLVADRLAEEVRHLEEAEAASQRQRAGEQPPAATSASGGAPAAAGGTAAASKRAQQAQREARGLVLSRRCIWFHHIKALGKRKHIVEWGGELGLGGYSKPGFPGIVLVEVNM